MGFGVEYFYYEKTDDGSYDKSNLKSMKRKVGDPLEDTPLNLLASRVLAQLARRDIWIHDIKIFEYKKQEITFKETKGGIILKNKKFTLDKIVDDLKGEEEEEVQQLSPQQLQQMQKIREAALQVNNGQAKSSPPSLLPNGIPCPVELAGKIPLRVEIFDPEPDHLRAGLVKGKFTTGKRYPIFSEQRDPREQQVGRELPILYVTVDDNARKSIVAGVVFRPVGAGLIGGSFEANSPRAGHGDGLVWDGIQDDSVQDIRRR